MTRPRRWLPPTWRPAIPQRQWLRRQQLSNPGLWWRRRTRGRRKGDDQGTPPGYLT